MIAWYLPIVTLGLALLGLGVRIVSGKTAWPRWFALVANPVSLVAIGAAFAFVSPEPVATWLGGAAFNLGLLHPLSAVHPLPLERRAPAEVSMLMTVVSACAADLNRHQLAADEAEAQRAEPGVAEPDSSRV